MRRLRGFERTFAMKLTPALRSAFSATVPVMTGYFCLGFAYGLLMSSKGFGAIWTFLMSAVVFGGSIQYLGVTLLAAAFDPLAALLLSVMVNARHVFYGLSMLEPYRAAGRIRPILIALLTDETFSIVSAMEVPEGVERKDFYLCVSVLDYFYWVAASVVGHLFGSLVTFDTTGMDFALTALFVVLFMEQWKHKANRFSGTIGIACAAVSLALFGAERMVIPAMVMILAVLLAGRRKAK